MLAMALGRVRSLQVAGAFGDGKVGLDFCLKTKPNLVVVDLYLPGMHGLEIVKEVRAKLPATRILVVTGHPDGDLPARLIAQGVRGFVDKDAPLSFALQAVESVMSGGMFFASHIQPKVTSEGSKAANAGPEGGARRRSSGRPRPRSRRCRCSPAVSSRSSGSWPRVFPRRKSPCGST